MTASSSLLQTLPAAIGDALGAQLGVSVAAAVVVTGAVGLALWLGRRVREDARRGIADAATGPEGPSELTSRHVFRVLQERKIASVEEIAAMSPRERQLLFDAVARKVTPLVGMPAVPAGNPAAAAAVAAPAVAQPGATQDAVGVLHCPACAAAIPAAAEANRVLAMCPGCGRRVTARRDGVRVSVTVDDPRPSGAGAPSPPPRRPSGGFPATRGRS